MAQPNGEPELTNDTRVRAAAEEIVNLHQHVHGRAPHLIYKCPSCQGLVSAIADAVAQASECNDCGKGPAVLCRFCVHKIRDEHERVVKERDAVLTNADKEPRDLREEIARLEQRVVEYEERLDGDEPLRTCVRKLEVAEVEIARLREQLASSVRDVKAEIEDRQAAVAAEREETRRLREALVKLLAELSDLHLMAIREGIGNTNAAVLQLRIDEARAALTPPAPEK